MNNYLRFMILLLCAFDLPCVGMEQEIPEGKKEIQEKKSETKPTEYKGRKVSREEQFFKSRCSRRI